MITILEYIDSTMAADMIVALLHTLWQGLAIALILFFVLKYIPAGRSEMRYRLGIMSLLLIVVCWLGTFSILQYEPATSAPQTSVTNTKNQVEHAAIADNTKTIAQDHAGGVQFKTTTIPSAEHRFRTVKDGRFNYTAWVMVFWLTGVCVMLARMFWAMAGVAKLKHDAVDIHTPAILELFEQLCRKMDVKRKIRFAASNTLMHPGVIGFWRPVLLVPVSILSEISTDDLRAILAHELAHIRRFDYLINFCQMVVEAVLFFNPAVWWVSQRIRIEREVCCDAAGITVAGQRVQYAKVLFEQIARTASPQPATAVALTGFSDDNASASEERIHRIIHPQHKPRMRIGWAKLTLLIGIAGVTILGLWKTTDVTVKAAAKMLTPQERIKKIAEIKNEFIPDYDGPATIEISGIVSTIDGRTPENWHIRTVSGNTHASIGGPGCDPNSAPKTTFKGKLYPGISYLYAICEGYAPFITEMELEQGEFLDGIEIIFDHGFDSKIKVVDQNGNAVAGAAISGRLTAAGSTFGNGFKTVSSDDGTAVCEKITRWPLSMKVVAPGYQKVEGYKVELKPDEVETIVLSKGTPSGGTVVSSKTGKPVANAEFRIIHKDKPGHSWGYGIRSDVAAVSDDNGVFVLDTLEAGATYSIMVSSPDHRNTFVSNIGPGNMDLKIEMEPAVVVNTIITGDLSKLSQGWHTVDGEHAKGPQIQVNCILQRVRGIHNDFKSYPVKIEDGVGYVHIDNAMGSRLDFQIDGKTVYKLDILDGKSQYDITMDTAGLPGPPERDVVITFTAGQEMPLPEGKVWVSGRPDGDSEWYSHHAKVENGIAKFKVPAPCTMSISSNNRDKLTGYWFVPVRDIKIEPSDAPFEFEVKVKPGGTIFGNIYDAQGNKVNGARMSIQLVNDIEGVDASDRARIGNYIAHDAGRSGSYSAMSLPFGGKYKFEAVHENYVMLSPKLEISEKEPIVQHDFNKGRSINLKGKILKHDSSAGAGVDYQLYRSSKLVSGGLGKMKTANKNGEFVIEGVNPDVKVDYSLKVYDRETGRQEKFKLKCTQRNQTLKLAKPILIKGRVINSDTTEGIPGMRIWASTTINNHTDFTLRGNGITDNDGYFEVYVSSGDRYGVGIEDESVRDFHGGHVSSVSTYSKRIGSPDEDILFEVRPNNSLSGQVIDASTGQPIAGAKISGILWITKSHKSAINIFSPVTDGEGKFQLPSFDGIAYEIKEIKGYSVVGEKMIKFEKDERHKTLAIKVKKF